MTALRSLPLLALATLAACSSAARTPPPVPAPAASATGPLGSSEPASGQAPPDSRIVRCGVDDRPHSVASRLDLGPSPLPVVGEPPAAPPVPPLLVEVLPMTSPAGGPVPRLTSVLESQYEQCASVAAADEPLRVVTLGFEVAPGGAPLRVLPPADDAAPTPLVRCLMERTCQLQVAAPGQKTRLDVPMRVGHDHAPPPSRLNVTTEKPVPAVAELQVQLREEVASVLRRCDPVRGRARVRLSLEVMTTDGTWSTPRRRRNWRADSPPPPRTEITSAIPETLEGDVSVVVLGCLTGGLSGQRFPRLTVPGIRTERLLLTWQP